MAQGNQPRVFPPRRWVGWSREVPLPSPFSFLTGTTSSMCHIFSSVFYSGPKPTNLLVENGAVVGGVTGSARSRRSEAELPPLSSQPEQRFIPLLPHSQPATFSFLPLWVCKWILHSTWPWTVKNLTSAILFQDGKQTCKVNLTYPRYASTASQVQLQGGGNQYLWKWPENKNLKIPKAVRLKPRSLCIRATSQLTTILKITPVPRTQTPFLALSTGSHLTQAFTSKFYKASQGLTHFVPVM